MRQSIFEMRALDCPWDDTHKTMGYMGLARLCSVFDIVEREVLFSAYHIHLTKVLMSDN